MRRFSLSSWIFVLSACLLMWLPVAEASSRIQIVTTQLEQTDEGYKLDATYHFDLNEELRGAVDRGVPLFFTTVVEVVQPRWYWFDNVLASRTRTKRLAFNVLTRQYRVTTSSGQNYYFESIEDALYAIQQPSDWVIADKGTLKSGATYQLSLRMYLDLEHLPKPFQVNAFNNKDWRLSSEWKVMAFRADNK